MRAGHSLRPHQVGRAWLAAGLACVGAAATASLPANALVIQASYSATVPSAAQALVHFQKLSVGIRPPP